MHARNRFFFWRNSPERLTDVTAAVTRRLPNKTLKTLFNPVQRKCNFPQLLKSMNLNTSLNNVSPIATPARPTYTRPERSNELQTYELRCRWRVQGGWTGKDVAEISRVPHWSSLFLSYTPTCHNPAAVLQSTHELEWWNKWPCALPHWNMFAMVMSLTEIKSSHRRPAQDGVILNIQWCLNV